MGKHRHIIDQLSPEPASIEFVENAEHSSLTDLNESDDSSEYSVMTGNSSRNSSGHSLQSGDSPSHHHYIYDENGRDASATFFSDKVDDRSLESVYNHVPIGEEGSDSGDSADESNGPDGSDKISQNIPTHSSYTTEIPEYYDAQRLTYPGTSPYMYSEEEFARINHFHFLKSLNMKEPPLLPPYLNPNLLNDSPAKDYKLYPYQYQDSNHIYINDQYSYQINKLNVMDKYSSLERQNQKSPSAKKQPVRPPMKRSSSSTRSIRNDLLKKKEAALQPQKVDPKDIDLRHQDYIQDVEEHHNLVPSHVMLNHLITCNLKMNKVMTCSCIHRYSGKFITQIVYFSIEGEGEGEER
ncbi:DEKNAAC103605 [Brettanomyces naardenensis]|uniref:DEKNAAC103605 n=1 Tax=Brettanomyces naardenensis TaxID=13370 RepID=A0A448YNI8_BRENA|nr:DEKNAAC103605 [Brettanomyces naardenensis]